MMVVHNIEDTFIIKDESTVHHTYLANDAAVPPHTNGSATFATEKLGIDLVSTFFIMVSVGNGYVVCSVTELRKILGTMRFYGWNLLGFALVVQTFDK